MAVLLWPFASVLQRTVVVIGLEPLLLVLILLLEDLLLHLLDGLHGAQIATGCSHVCRIDEG